MVYHRGIINMGVDFMDEFYSLIPLEADAPQGADLCFVMDSELMEPLIRRGEKVFVSRRESPAEPDVGLFYYRGRVYCRQFCEDYAGNFHLLCANPKRESENLCLDRVERQRCLCLGKVLLDNAPTMPVYV